MICSGVILMGVLALAFAILVTINEGKYTLVTQQLHDLSEYGDANQLHNDELLSLFRDNVKL